MKISEKVIKEAKDLLENYVCDDLKQATEKFISDAEKTGEADAEAYVAVLRDSVASIDDSIAFAQSDYCRQSEGEAAAKQLLDSCLKAKANGAIYCGCPGCTGALGLIMALTE